MDRTGFIEKRKGRYMAQILSEYEEKVVPHLPDSAHGDSQEFKAFVRSRLKSLADDAADLVELGDGVVNGVAQEIRDRLSPTGRP